MSKYELDLDYQIPMVDITKEELEEIIVEATTIIAENNDDSEKLAIAYLKKAQAMQKLQECITTEPNNADAQYQIKALVEKALELHPDMPEAIMQMGKVYDCLKKFVAKSTDEEYSFFDEAVKWFSKAIELKPDYAPAINNLGNMHAPDKPFVLINDVFKRNIFLPKKPSTREKETYEDRLKKAVTCYTEAIQIRPFDATYYFNRGNQYLRMGEYEKALADYTSTIAHGSVAFKKFTRIYHYRGKLYLKMNETEKAHSDFKEYLNNTGELKEHSCFLCVNSFGHHSYPIGSKGIELCPDCLEKIGADTASVFSITGEDIEKYKQERKNENEKREKKIENIRRLPEILTKTISENKKIKCYKLIEEPVVIDASNIEEFAEKAAEHIFNSMHREPEATKSKCQSPATEIPKDGISDRQMPEDETCSVCKRNCYVTEALFMMRNNLWICPDCLKYIDINDENVSSLITNEEIAECRTYLDINTPEGKEVHSILNRDGRTTCNRRIISWNCHYGFTEDKAAAIKPYNADILVIPECREIDMETSGYDAQHRYWYGDHKEATDEHGNINKEKDLGIGVFWKDRITVTPLTQWEKTLCKNSDFRYLVPFNVQLGYYAKPFTLIAVWTKGKVAGTNDTLEYVEKAHAAFDHYAHMGLLDDRVVIIGDFNSNAIWDDKYSKEKNHTALVEKLKQKGVVDCSAINGESNHSTYCYYTETGEKQVIDDYCFASKDMTKNAFFSVPDGGDWKLENGVKRWHGSDHFPICVEMDIQV